MGFNSDIVLIFAVFPKDFFLYHSGNHPTFIKIVVVFDLDTP